MSALASLLLLPVAAAACDDPSGDCGGAFSDLSEETVRVAATASVALIVGTAAMVWLSRRHRRLQAASATLLAVEAAGLVMGAVVVAASA